MNANQGLTIKKQFIFLNHFYKVIVILRGILWKNMIKFKKAIFDDNTVKQLLDLSKKWADEDISFGLVPNEREHLEEPCYIALDGDQIVGYIFGHVYETEKKTSYIPIGAKCFEISEVYVLPTYRSKGIGKRLFELIEEEAKNDASYITLATSTKDYKRILKFYVEDLDMTFHSAFLLKKN